ncbi:PREDICTED: uncharacterized protein LOC108562004 [Nicrophorus vespilloides]|uniref:Uncharacterized protein LOC108562004 n=1 Tax=Nicrophorus vespilloides TaxID=110193 RepID=A0ABM1MM67_NICVS|nr:PREDICTED: uncharacterized protein LOC108562004 [Nicrophorus vespilloides]
MHLLNYYCLIVVFVSRTSALNSCSGRPPLLYSSLENCCGFLMNKTDEQNLYLDDCWGTLPFLYDKDDLDSLTVSNSFINWNPESKIFTQDVSIKELKVINSNIKSIGEENFINLHKVEIIDLSYNDIADIRLNTFTHENLPNLKVINLTGNPLSEESLLILKEISKRFEDREESVGIYVYFIIAFEILAIIGLSYGIWKISKLSKRKSIPVATREDHDNSALQLELEDQQLHRFEFEPKSTYSSFNSPVLSLNGYEYYDGDNEDKL